MRIKQKQKILKLSDKSNSKRNKNKAIVSTGEANKTYYQI